MCTNEEKDKDIQALAPPSDKELEVKDKLSLVLEMIWLNCLIPILALWSLYRRFFPAPEKSLKGQVALVTGGGRGLGSGLAMALAREGCMVAVADVNLATAEDTAEQIRKGGGRAKAYRANVAKTQEIRDLRDSIAKDFGPVDLLVNNAGLIYAEPVESCTDAAVLGVLSVNLLSHFLMAREFLPAMRERNSGHIVAIASASSFGVLANASAYVASKYGVRGFMETLRQELDSKPGNNIKTTTVFPYFTNTSAHYIDHWDLRLPALSIDEVVEATMSAIKREAVSICIPESLYYSLHFRWLLPQYITDAALNIFYARVKVPTKEEVQQLPNTAIIRDLYTNKL